MQALLPYTDLQWHSNALFLASIHQRRECIKILLKLSCCAQELLNELKTMYSSDVMGQNGVSWRKNCKLKILLRTFLPYMHCIREKSDLQFAHGIVDAQQLGCLLQHFVLAKGGNMFFKQVFIIFVCKIFTS